MREFALPGTVPRYPPDRTCAVRHYRLELELDVPARRIRGTATLTLEALSADATSLRLDAVELEVAAVRIGGRAVEFGNDGRQLWIEVGERAIGAGFEVAIEYSTRPRRGLYFIAPDEGYPDKPVQVWTQGQDEDSRHWFPCLDSPSEKATSEVVVTVPGELFALSNGELVDDRRDGDRRTLHWRYDVPHSCYLITLVAGRFSAIESKAGDVELAYYCAPDREDDCRRTLGRTPEMLELFGRLFGTPYPYHRYAQVFVADFIFGGMENTTASTLTDTVLYDERAALDYQADALVAHELAHQWFGDLLTCRTWGEGWLNEGFATYAEYLWREHKDGRDEADLELEDWAAAYFGEDQSRYRRIIATNVYDEPIDIFDHHLYEKGGRVLHMLRHELGDADFWRTIRHYLTKHRVGSVETRDLQRAVNHATGRDLDWFFDQWVTRGAGHPTLEVGYAWHADKKLAGFTVKQTHKVEGVTPLFRLPLEIELTVGGTTHRHAFTVTDAQHGFLVPCASQPTRAIVDPGKTLLAQLKVDKPLPMWLSELAAAPLAIDRREAARRLGQHGGHQATSSLVVALAGDEHWGVRAAAAEALAGMRTEVARDALIAALTGERHPKARRAIVRALGGFRGDEPAAGALLPLVERGEPSYFVEAEACLSLGKTRSPRAFVALEAAARRDSFTDVIRQYAYRALAELGDARAFAPLLEGTRYGMPSHGRRAAILALAELTRGQRDRDARTARERAEELLADRDFRIQAAAIEALASIGDPAAIGALERRVPRELDGRLRRRAREVIRDLAAGRASGEQVSALRDELDRLKADAARLRERVDLLEHEPRRPRRRGRTSTSPPPRGRTSTSPPPRGRSKGKPGTPSTRRR